MDDSEKLACEYLKWRGFKSVEFEPEGDGKPPDFLVEGRIAVEIRRLNQNEIVDGQRRGLEERKEPIWKDISKALDSLGPPAEGVSWYVRFRFARPAPRRLQLARAVRKALSEFQDSETSPVTISLFENFNFSLKLTRAGTSYSQRFVMGGCSDLDSGGWLIPELEKNLQICIDEKTEKIAPIRTKYPEWWLVLIDHINYGIRLEESLRIQRRYWDKIILVSPMDHTRAFEI